MARKSYGLPYMGSKNKIAEKIVGILPKARNLYDLFAGGCAISHCALISGKWENIIANDISDMPNLFVDAINGDLRDVKRWVSREEFNMFKESDPFVRCVWSFGNNGVDYLYSRELEPYKKALHEMLFAPTVDERRLKYRVVVKELRELLYKSNGNVTTTHLSMESLERIRSLSALQSVERVERIRSLSALQSVEIVEDSIIYCDIPYMQTTSDKGNKYGSQFNHQEFYDWCEAQTQPVFISEYWMPEDRFECIAQWELTCSLSAQSNSTKRVEKLFRPKTQL